MSKRRKKHDDWCRLHVRWYADPVLVEAADVEPAVMVVWPVLIAKAKDQSHVDKNPDGVVSTSYRKLAHDTMLDEATVENALDVLVQGEFIDVTKSRFNGIRVRLESYCDWQDPKGSTADTNTRREASRAGKKHSEHTQNTHETHDEHTANTRLDTDTDTDGMERAVRAIPSSVDQTIASIREWPGCPHSTVRSNVAKLIGIYPDLPVDSMSEAIVAFEQRQDVGVAIHPSKAWSSLRNCFRIAHENHQRAEAERLAESGKCPPDVKASILASMRPGAS